MKENFSFLIIFASCYCYEFGSYFCCVCYQLFYIHSNRNYHASEHALPWVFPYLNPSAGNGSSKIVGNAASIVFLVSPFSGVCEIMFSAKIFASAGSRSSSN